MEGINQDTAVADAAASKATKDTNNSPSVGRPGGVDEPAATYIDDQQQAYEEAKRSGFGHRVGSSTPTSGPVSSPSTSACVTVSSAPNKITETDNTTPHPTQTVPATDVTPIETALHLASTGSTPRIDDLMVDVVINDNMMPTDRSSADIGENERISSMNESNVEGGTGPTEGSNSSNHVTAEEMELTSMKVKIICQEKNILALKMELKSAELQVEAKEKVDAKKTRLIELLDAKLAAVEKRNLKLLEMMEQMLKEKEANSSRLKDATKNMTDLSERLIDSERMKTELLRINAELKKMLGNLESKGSQIAKLAKEKVLKYKDENDLMHIEITGLKNDAADAAASRAEAAVINNGSVAAAARSCLEAEGVTAWSSVSASLKRLLDSLQSVTSLVTSSTTASNPCDSRLGEVINEVTKAREEVQSSIEQVRQKTHDRLMSLSLENDQLRAVVDDFEKIQKRHDEKERNHRSESAEAENQRAAKEKEMHELKEELQRLKGAIAQLIGIK